jgi:hypothetical protein
MLCRRCNSGLSWRQVHPSEGVRCRRKARRRAQNTAERPRHQQAKEARQMWLCPRSILLAAGLVLFGTTQAAAGKLCKPVLSLRDARVSEAREMHRTWSGILTADASRCSTASGQFDVQFTRLKETAPDLQFMERFTWVSGQSEVSLDFWWDEWLEESRIISIAPCPCRN